MRHLPLPILNASERKLLTDVRRGLAVRRHEAPHGCALPASSWEGRADPFLLVELHTSDGRVMTWRFELALSDLEG